MLLPAVIFLAACQDDNANDQGELPQSAPTVSITASPAAVDSGGSSTLSWSSTGAQSCTASNSWSGSRATSGSEVVGPITLAGEYTLVCVGAGGSTSESVNITINSAGNGPTLSLTANPATVSVGSQSTLSWTAENAQTCTASGNWSGSRPTSGNELTGNLAADASYTMVCSGPAGSVSDSVSVTVVASNGAGIQGKVDSSLVNRSGENQVYVFSRTSAPDDFDGDAGDPLMVADVSQDAGACTFGYDLSAIVPGEYTLAFTGDAANDSPGINDPISFYGVVDVTVTNTTELVDFGPANVIRVGPGRPYQSVSAAASVAQNGDVIEIDAGLYSADVASWYQDNLTIRGVGGYAHLRADGVNAQGKAIWVIGGNNTVIENIEFSAITVPDRNGAGIRHDGSNLVVCNGYFHDSDEGILGGAGDVLVEYSEFANNGFGDGFSHNMYILEADSFTLRYSYTHHARIGHNVKTRARENYILYNRIMDESSGSSSYGLDIPNGGLSFVIGNLIQQGPNSDNSSMVNYGTEGLLGGRTHNLYLVNNTLVDDRGGEFIQAAGGTSLIRLINNLFVGSGAILSGASATMTTNLQTTQPELVGIGSYDYRLTSASPARDSGSAPGIGNGIDLTPLLQYSHKSNRVARPVDNAIDIGAYEFSP